MRILCGRKKQINILLERFKSELFLELVKNKDKPVEFTQQEFNSLGYDGSNDTSKYSNLKYNPVLAKRIMKELRDKGKLTLSIIKIDDPNA